MRLARVVPPLARPPLAHSRPGSIHSLTLALAICPPPTARPAESEDVAERRSELTSQLRVIANGLGILNELRDSGVSGAGVYAAGGRVGGGAGAGGAPAAADARAYGAASPTSHGHAAYGYGAGPGGSSPPAPAPAHAGPGANAGKQPPAHADAPPRAAHAAPVPAPVVWRDAPAPAARGLTRQPSAASIVGAPPQLSSA